MRRKLGLALAFVLAVISASAMAMGLGEIRLNSYLNQRLDAEIELVSAAADEIESLKIELADDAAFERYGLDRTSLHSSVRFNIVRRPNGTAYVHVTTTEPVREPFVTLLVVADWSRGRLMREYTLLIDPPTFAREAEAEAAEAQAPAVAPAPQPREAVQVPVDEAPTAPVVAAEQQTGDVVSIPPLDAEAEPAAPIRREPEQAEPELGGNYGPIQRNETLWGIAQRLRPDESVTINQMMIALYRANPEAFQGNINRLKAGYILRVPEYGEIATLARSEAFNEVKRQNDEWRGVRTPAPQAVEPVDVEPELSLVAPEDDLEADTGLGVGAGGEADDLDFAEETADVLDEAPVDDVDQDAVDLGVEAETEDRLLDIEDESMQALQEQEEFLQEPEAETETETADIVEAPPLPGEEAASEPAGEQPDVADAVSEETPAEAEQQAVETAPESSPTVIAPVRREPTLVEKLTELALQPLGLGVIALLVVLLLAGFLVMRKRRAAAQNTNVVIDWSEEEGDDATIVARSDEDGDVTVVTGGRDDDIATVFAHGLEHEDTGTTKLDDETATQMLGDHEDEYADKTQMLPSERADDFTETVVGGQAMTLDDNDPLSEADFHMAYGLYDQAAEVVEKAVQRDPTRKAYHAKLAEIYFAGNNTDGFLEAAGRLKELAGPGDSDWDNVAIMGRQIAPDNAMFAEGGSTSAVDLDFGSAAEEFGGETVVGTPAPATPVDDSLDFDLDLDAKPGVEEEEPVFAADDSSSDESFDLDLDAGSVEETPAAPVASDEGDDFNFDLGETEADSVEETSGGDVAGYDDAQTQTEFDKALEELSAFVDTNVPEEDAGGAVSDDSELNLDDYSFDEDAGGGEEMAGTGEDEEDIGEIGTKLDLARAYIDMGDPDGARGILEEVISDGDADQQREARELLEQLA